VVLAFVVVIALLTGVVTSWTMRRRLDPTIINKTS